ncbi:15625_t:CDS:2, partial [Acaulospora colombiana]
ETIFTDLPYDISSYITSMSSENPSISTQDIFKPLAPQSSSAEVSTSATANAFEPSLGAFSDSASPADSHSPSQSAHADDQPSDSDDDSDDMEDDFIASSSKRATTSRGKGANTTAKSKRSATKPKPYPRVSDVVRDAPHKLAADGKRQPATTELKGSVRSADAADDDWRPTMEEYQRMSSKEKRQLRNKISARNFQYITTLEGEVAARDQQLETYREELTSTRSENSELRKEIERLKREIMEGRSGGSIFEDSPVETKPNVLLETSNKSTRASRSSIVRPNRNKDLPSSGSTRGFWGGATMGGTTSVHTTLIPDFDI